MDETLPRMTDQSDVKVIICYLLDRTDRSVTEEQLGIICESVGIDYFMLKDAVNDLLETGALIKQGDLLSIGENGHKSSEYFSKYLPLVFRRRILKEALGYFRTIGFTDGCECCVEENDGRYSVHFSVDGGGFQVLDLTLLAGDREQAEKLAENIRMDPMESCSRLAEALMQEHTDPDTDRYL
ncbi:MAG: DUF4364 family protein [Oscillospiraceae bacterium]|nr:DUF4364 family protein [Oscillospiraceae bacterium]